MARQSSFLYKENWRHLRCPVIPHTALGHEEAAGLCVGAGGGLRMGILRNWLVLGNQVRFIPAVPASTVILKREQRNRKPIKKAQLSPSKET